jgi:hypothetical protein
MLSAALVGIALNAKAASCTVGESANRSSGVSFDAALDGTTYPLTD